MNARRHGEKVLLQLNNIEAQLLLRVLRVIIENYHASPADIDAATAEVWYSTRGCRTAKMSAEESQQWLASLHQLKVSNLRRLEDWAAALAKPKASNHRFVLDRDETDMLLTAFNDYRLMTAARHDVGEAEMNLWSESDVGDLPHGRCAALMEIHLLAWVMEEILRASAD